MTLTVKAYRIDESTGKMLGKLEEEVQIIRANTTFGEMTIEQRTRNILDAIMKISRSSSQEFSSNANSV